MASKLVLFFQQFERGWTETWYSTSSDPRTLVEVAITNLTYQDAVSFRHESTYLRAVRATVIGGTKKSYSHNFGFNLHGTSKRTLPPTPDVCSTDAVVRVDTIDGFSKRMFVRGLKDDDVIRTNDGADQPSAQLRAKIGDYINNWSAIPISLRRVLQPGEGVVVKYNVTQVRPVAGNTSRTDVLFDAAPGAEIVVGSRVRFGRVPFDDLPGFPPSATVLEVNPAAANGIRISYFLREQAPVFTVAMSAMLQAYAYPTISGVGEQKNLIERFSERKTGRPFGLQRGRARAKVRAL